MENLPSLGLSQTSADFNLEGGETLTQLSWSCSQDEKAEEQTNESAKGYSQMTQDSTALHSPFGMMEEEGTVCDNKDDVRGVVTSLIEVFDCGQKEENCASPTESRSGELCLTQDTVATFQLSQDSICRDTQSIEDRCGRDVAGGGSCNRCPTTFPNVGSEGEASTSPNVGSEGEGMGPNPEFRFPTGDTPKRNLRETRPGHWIKCLSFDEENFSADALHFAVGMSIQSGSHTPKVYFCRAQYGYSVHLNANKKSGSRIEFENLGDRNFNEAFGVYVATTVAMARAGECRLSRNTGVVHVQRVLQEMREVLYLLFHLLASLYETVYPGANLHPSFYFMMLRQTLQYFPTKDGCRKATLLLVQSIHLADRCPAFSQELHGVLGKCEIWNFWRTAPARIHGYKEHLCQLENTMLDIHRLVETSGYRHKVLIETTRTYSEERRCCLRKIPDPLHALRCANVANAVSICSTSGVTASHLKETVNVYFNKLDEQKEQRSQAAKRRSAIKRAEETRKKARSCQGGSINNGVESPPQSAPHEWGIFKPLDELEEKRVQRALGGNPRIMVGSISVEGVRRLVRGLWINDDPVQVYFGKMAGREKRRYEEGLLRGGERPSHCFSSQFYNKLVQGMKDPVTGVRYEGGFNYNGVRRWGRKCPGGNLFNLRRALVPMNHLDIHWLLAEIDFVLKKIIIWDSLRSLKVDTVPYKHNLWLYLTEEYKQQHGGREMPSSEQQEWKTVDAEEAVQQPNECDCGLFTIFHAELLLRGETAQQLKLLVENGTRYKEMVKNCRRRLAILSMSGPE